MGINVITITGNLGADPESFEYGPQNDRKQGCKFRVGVSNPPRNGEPQDSDWFGVSVFGPQAKACLDNLAKGRPVGVTGRMKSRTVDSTKHAGEKVTFWDVIANDVQFIGPRPEGGNGGQAAEPTQAKEDLPF